VLPAAFAGCRQHKALAMQMQQQQEQLQEQLQQQAASHKAEADELQQRLEQAEEQWGQRLAAAEAARVGSRGAHLRCHTSAQREVDVGRSRCCLLGSTLAVLLLPRSGQHPRIGYAYRRMLTGRSWRLRS